MTREWTTSEDATLRAIWASTDSLRLRLRELPGRSFSAARGRAVRLGLGGSASCTKRRVAVESKGAAAINAVLTAGRPLTTIQLAERTGLQRAYVGRRLNEGHGSIYHVAGWTRARAHGDWYPRWALGRAEDAERPRSKDPIIASREYRSRLRMKRAPSPFAVLIQQVVA